MKMTKSDVSAKSELCLEDHGSDFIPIIRSGAWTDIGFRTSMEDVCVCMDNFMDDYGFKSFADRPSAFYGVFSSHQLLGKIVF